MSWADISIDDEAHTGETEEDEATMTTNWKMEAKADHVKSISGRSRSGLRKSLPIDLIPREIPTHSVLPAPVETSFLWNRRTPRPVKTG
jgi:hypothetical protein